MLECNTRRISGGRLRLFAAPFPDVCHFGCEVTGPLFGCAALVAFLFMPGALCGLI